MGEKPNALSLSDTKDLVDEVFRVTGMKVSADDPIVVATLIQSHLFRCEGSEVVEAISNAMQAMPAHMEGVEARISGLIDQVNRAGESYLRQINKVVNAEAETVKADLRSEVNAVLSAEITGPIEQIKRTNRAGIWRSLMFGMAGAGIAVVIALAGVRHYDPMISNAFNIATNIDRAWNGLTPAERQHIKQLAKPQHGQ